MKSVYKFIAITGIFLVHSASYANSFEEDLKTIAFQKDSKKKYTEMVELSENYSDYERFVLISELIRLAYYFRMQNDLKLYYSQSLSLSEKYTGDWNVGNVLHAAYNYMGASLIDNGNIAGALDNLHKSCRVPTTPQLGSYGPDMLLADKMLDLGYKDEVIEHLNSCKSIWRLSDGRLDSWISAINGGGSPYFKNNIRRIIGSK